jgi:hypothetical protein
MGYFSGKKRKQVPYLRKVMVEVRKEKQKPNFRKAIDQVRKKKNRCPIFEWLLVR